MANQTPTNSVTDIVDAILSQLIYTVGVDAAIAAAVAKFPFLAFPIIGPIFRGIVKSIADKVFGAIKPFVNINIIKFQNEAQQAAYDKAVAELRKAQESGDEDAVKKATEKTKSALDDLINFNH